MKVTDDVLAILDQAQTEGNRLMLTAKWLDRKLYEKTNKVLEAAGGTWNRKAKAHLFDGDAAEAIEQVILSGEIATHQDFDFFPTPKPIVARLLELAEVGTYHRVLEPSAGTGNIVVAIGNGPNKVAVEINFDYLAHLMVRGVSRLQIHQGDFLACTPIGNWLKGDIGTFDRVVMNPPFSKQQDIKHVLHALKFLKPGGRLVSVMSASVTFRQNKLTAEFRQLVEDRGGMIEPNPDDAFKESGTRVRTVNVVIPRR